MQTPGSTASTVANARKHQIESINFEYTAKDFADDWLGVRRYAKHRPSMKAVVHLAASPDRELRRISMEKSTAASTVSQWFIDRYGHDPNYLYARFMRFTMLAHVLEDYQREISEAGLSQPDGYSPELLSRLLKLRIRSDDHGFPCFDQRMVLSAIDAAKEEHPL